jgi:hypothetical protein
MTAEGTRELYNYKITALPSLMRVCAEPFGERSWRVL